MKIYIIAIFFVLICPTGCTVLAQELMIKQIDSLKFTNSKYASCNSIYWRVVANGENVIPYLIDRIDDTTATRATDKCKTANLCVGDLCYYALIEIMPISLFAVSGQQFDTYSNGCNLGVVEWIDKNRQRFKSDLRQWYYTEKTSLVWVRFKGTELTDCRKINKINGWYNYRLPSGKLVR